tara:strand:- start:271 stop:846 length:576 start_codon:yes stop_codon:yes gene_type:complete
MQRVYNLEALYSPRNKFFEFIREIEKNNPALKQRITDAIYNGICQAKEFVLFLPLTLKLNQFDPEHEDVKSERVLYMVYMVPDSHPANNYVIEQVIAIGTLNIFKLEDLMTGGGIELFVQKKRSGPWIRQDNIPPGELSFTGISQERVGRRNHVHSVAIFEVHRDGFLSPTMRFAIDLSTFPTDGYNREET